MKIIFIIQENKRIGKFIGPILCLALEPLTATNYQELVCQLPIQFAPVYNVARFYFMKGK